MRYPHLVTGTRDLLLVGALAVSCSKPHTPTGSPSVMPPATSAPTEASPISASTLTPDALGSSPTAQVPRCGGGRRMTVHFYDVRQGLAALGDLPYGRR